MDGYFGDVVWSGLQLSASRLHLRHRGKARGSQTQPRQRLCGVPKCREHRDSELGLSIQSDRNQDRRRQRRRGAAAVFVSTVE